MPHVVWDLGNLAATADVGGTARLLVPGMAPGMGMRNIFEQQRMKRVLLIRDCRLVYNGVVGMGAGPAEALQYNLKLSQEADLTPGHLLRVGTVSISGNGTDTSSVLVEQQFTEQGSLWASLWVGIRAVESGAIDVDCDIELDYDVVEVPWEQWFIMWEFLDGTTDNSRES